MPVIPGVNEDAVIQSGVANQAISTEEASLKGQATSELGRSMVQLGNILDSTIRTNQNKISKYNAEAAIADYTAAQQAFIQEDIESGAKGTMTGQDAVTRMRDNGTKLRDDLIKAYGLSGEMQGFFIANTKDVDNKFSPNLYSASAKAAKEAKDFSEQIMLQKKGQVISQNMGTPKGLLMLDEALALHAEDVLKDPTVRADEREKAIIDGQQKITLAAYNELRFNNKFDQAAILLKSKQALFDNKVIKEELNALDSDRAQYINSQYTQEQRKELQLKKELESAQQLAAVTLLNEREQAGTSDAKLSLNTLKINFAEAKGEISAAMAKSLREHQPGTRKYLDDLTAGGIMGKVYSTGNISWGLKEIDKAFKKGQVSASQYYETQRELGKYSMFNRGAKAQREFDFDRMVVQNVLDYFKDIGKDPNALNAEQLKKMYLIRMDAISAMKSMRDKGQSVDVKKVIEGVASSYGAEFSPSAHGVSNSQQNSFRSSQDLENTYKQLRKEWDTNSSKWDGPTKVRKLKDIEAIKNKVIQKRKDESLQGGNGAGSTNTRAARAAGKL